MNNFNNSSENKGNEGNQRIDDLQNGFFIIQNPKDFCFGIDAVLLSNFVSLKNVKRALDLGCGNGIIPILLQAKAPVNVVGLEIQESSVSLARKSVSLNNLEENITIHQGDIKEIPTILKGQKFDIVVSNPPYMNSGGGILNEKESLAIARHEVKCTLEDVIKGAAYVLNHLGRFYMIHRPSRLVDIITTLRLNKLEPKCIRFVHSYKDTEAVFVLVEASLGGKAFSKIMPPIFLYERLSSAGDTIFA